MKLKSISQTYSKISTIWYFPYLQYEKKICHVGHTFHAGSFSQMTSFCFCAIQRRTKKLYRYVFLSLHRICTSMTIYLLVGRKFVMVDIKTFKAFPFYIAFSTHSTCMHCGRIFSKI